MSLSRMTAGAAGFGRAGGLPTPRRDPRLPSVLSGQGGSRPPGQSRQAGSGGGSIFDSAREFFLGIFPDDTLTPEQLRSKEADLAAGGLEVLVSASGIAHKVRLSNGLVVDVIGGSERGANIRQFMDTGVFLDAEGNQIPGPLGGDDGTGAPGSPGAPPAGGGDDGSVGGVAGPATAGSGQTLLGGVPRLRRGRGSVFGGRRPTRVAAGQTSRA